MKPGKQRRFGIVLLLSIITIGIYFWIWLFVNLKEIRQGIEFQDADKSVKFAWILYFLLLLVIILSFSLNIMLHSLEVADGLDIAVRILGILLLILILAFFYFFTDSVALAQSKKDIEPLNIVKVYGLFLLSFIIVALTPFLTDPETGPIFSLVGLVVGIVYFFQMQSHINRLWQAVSATETALSRGGAMGQPLVEGQLQPQPTAPATEEVSSGWINFSYIVDLLVFFGLYLGAEVEWIAAFIISEVVGWTIRGIVKLSLKMTKQDAA